MTPKMHSTRWLEALLSSGAAPDGTWILVKGGSMEPTYFDGDWLLVEPLAGSRPIRSGEVVVARRDLHLVTHRIVALRSGIAVTRGDACTRVDPPIPAAALLGRVVEVRQGRGLRRFVRRLARRIIPAPRLRAGGRGR
jgi:signal peptidase I